MKYVRINQHVQMRDADIKSTIHKERKYRDTRSFITGVYKLQVFSIVGEIYNKNLQGNNLDFFFVHRRLPKLQLSDPCFFIMICPRCIYTNTYYGLFTNMASLRPTKTYLPWREGRDHSSGIPWHSHFFSLFTSCILTSQNTHFDISNMWGVNTNCTRRHISSWKIHYMSDTIHMHTIGL